MPAAVKPGPSFKWTAECCATKWMRVPQKALPAKMPMGNTVVVTGGCQSPHQFHRLLRRCRVPQPGFHGWLRPPSSAKCSGAKIHIWNYYLPFSICARTRSTNSMLSSFLGLGSLRLAKNQHLIFTGSDQTRKSYNCSNRLIRLERREWYQRIHMEWNPHPRKSMWLSQPGQHGCWFVTQSPSCLANLRPPLWGSSLAWVSNAGGGPLRP